MLVLQPRISMVVAWIGDWGGVSVGAIVVKVGVEEGISVFVGVTGVIITTLGVAENSNVGGWMISGVAVKI